jgi:hypothetical protein
MRETLCSCGHPDYAHWTGSGLEGERCHADGCPCAGIVLTKPSKYRKHPKHLVQ